MLVMPIPECAVLHNESDFVPEIRELKCKPDTTYSLGDLPDFVKSACMSSR